MSDPMVRHLARELSAMQDRIRAMEVASQAAFRSIEGGSIDVYDDETDELLGVIGVQKDGSVGVDIKASAKPQTPTEPDVVAIPGGAIVAWDGRFEDRQPWKAIDRVAVHMDETPGFTADRDTEVGAIMSRHGGTVVIPIDDGAEWYVKLVAVSKGFVWSDPSTEVFVAAVDSETAHFQDEFTLAVDGPQDLALTYEPEPFSEQLFWQPGGGAGLYLKEDVFWTREGSTITILDSDCPPAAGDQITVEYEYRADVGLSVPLGYLWKYKTGLGPSTTYAQTGFDDSAWTEGRTPFGWGDPGVPVSWSTTVPQPMDIWMRITVETLGGDLTFIFEDVDDDAWVYLDGALVDHVGRTSPTAGTTSGSFTTPCPAGTHVIAVYGIDDGNTNPAPDSLQKGYIGFAIQEGPA